MLIQQKFNYQSLERIDSPTGRKYIIKGSRPLPSVTTILGAIKDLTHLTEWQERVGINEAERIKTEASNVGNGMHKNLENHIIGGKLSGSYMSQILAKVIIKNGLSKVTEIWGSEVALYSKDLYAGTTDLIGVWGTTPAIIDFKNSLRDKKKEWIEDYFLQLAAYSLSHNEMFGTDINCGVIMIATRDAKYQEFIIEGPEFKHYQLLWTKKLCAYYDQYGYD